MLHILCCFRKKKKKNNSLDNSIKYTNVNNIPEYDNHSTSVNSSNICKKIEHNSTDITYKNLSVKEALVQYELNKEWSRLNINSIVDNNNLFIIYEEDNDYIS